VEQGRRRRGEGECIVMGSKGMYTSCVSFNGKAKVLSEKKRLERHQGRSNQKKFEESKKTELRITYQERIHLIRRENVQQFLVNQLGT
jgi:hypothetical protein